ncbi:MAG: FAD-dependent oxidoreductase [Proteobacteria bacterium]|nr:FAD-dependent oxidoreductase [Pseudomonadota bacterium]
MFDAAAFIATAAIPPCSADSTTIAVIGAGFSGTLTALHLLRRCPATTRVILIERGPQHGSGLAYGTPHPGHLLNVPAGKMSAFPDRPADFLHWLQQQPGIEATAGTFAPRGVYGAYVRSLLQATLQDPVYRGRLLLMRNSVVDMDQAERAVRLTCAQGEPFEADLVVLATGNLPPCPLPIGDGSFFETPFYRHDPWAPDALTNLDPAAPVLLMGTGLTMIDTVIALLDQGHTGPIQAVSRRGLLPHRHKPAAPLAAGSAPYPTRLAALVRFLRAQAKAAEANGSDWRAVVDALRPFTADLWQALSIPEQRRFLRHARPWWDIHRHRVAGPVAARIDAARASGQLQVQAGRLQSFGDAGDRATVTIQPRRGHTAVTLAAARVINCTGPGIECGRLTDPLLLALFRNGMVRPDPLGMALDVAPSGAVRGADGSLSRRVFAVGPLTRAVFWEMTAVPDIRRQCELLAQHLTALVTPPR